ncbi:10057_t:CDS:2, partial [Racocetra persica]
ASFEQVIVNNSVDVFWQTLGMALQRDVSELLGPLKNLQIKSASEFLNTFHRIHFTASSFNINEPFQNPNFTLEQVQFLYKEFADEYELTIDQEVIKDIYIQTNG